MNKAYWAGRHILITGGAGFIGSNLVCPLVEAGCKVRVADDLSRGRIEYLAPVLERIEFVKADLTRAEACRAAVEGIDTVFHLASRVGGIGFYLQKAGDVILQNTQMDTNLLRAAIEAGVARYLYASSAHVYPSALQGAPDSPEIREEQACPAGPELSYGWAKLYAEKQIQYVIGQGYPIRACIPRLIGAFGKNQDYDLDTGSAIPVFCRRAAEYPGRAPFTVWGTGRETRSYCFADDVIEGLLRSAEKLEATSLLGPFNLGAEGRIAMADLARLVIKASGKRIEPLFLTDKATVIWGQAVSCSLARKLLDGWEPTTPLDEALAVVYAHIQARLKAQGTTA